MTKVCIFTEKWGAGGIESFLILEHMDCSNLHIEIVTTTVISELFFPRLQKLHIPVHELSGKPYYFFKNHILFRKILKENQYDVIHLNVYMAVSYFYLVDAKKCGVRKRIVHSHNSALRRSVLKPLKVVSHNICKHALYGYATDFWTCSKKAADFMFPAKGRETISVKTVRNGIDIQKFSFQQEFRTMMRCKLNVADKLVIGNVGRLCNQKNQKFLIRVLACLLKKRQNAVLLLIGSGDLASIKKEAEKYGILDHIIFYGPSDNVEQLLCAMDIFAFPSKFEGFGIAALEAQSSGLPTVCSEEVPIEVDITPLFYRIGISEGSEQWSTSILSIAHRLTKRADYTRQIRESGYDILTVAKWISSEYCN